MGRKEEKGGQKLRGGRAARRGGGSTAPTQLCGQLQQRSREAPPAYEHALANEHCLRPCSYSKKYPKIFKIFCHIEFYDICYRVLDIDKNKN